MPLLYHHFQVNLSPSVSQPLIGRAQGVASAAGGGITQQAVLLGNATNAGALTQAQMYLRAQMVCIMCRIAKCMEMAL